MRLRRRACRRDCTVGVGVCVGEGVRVGDGVYVGEGVLVAVGAAGPALCRPGVFAELRYQSPWSPQTLALVGDTAAIADRVGQAAIRPKQAHAIAIVIEHRRWHIDHEKLTRPDYRACRQGIGRTAALDIVQLPAR